MNEIWKKSGAYEFYGSLDRHEIIATNRIDHVGRPVFGLDEACVYGPDEVWLIVVDEKGLFLLSKTTFNKTQFEYRGRHDVSPCRFVKVDKSYFEDPNGCELVKADWVSPDVLTSWTMGNRSYGDPEDHLFAMHAEAVKWRKANPDWTDEECDLDWIWEKSGATKFYGELDEYTVICEHRLDHVYRHVYGERFLCAPERSWLISAQKGLFLLSETELEDARVNSYRFYHMSDSYFEDLEGCEITKIKYMGTTLTTWKLSEESYPDAADHLRPMHAEAVEWSINQYL